MVFVRNSRFDNVGVFTYSDEEGTPAFDLPNKVDPKTAMQRRNRLMKEQAKISKQLNKAKVGETYKVMFEGLSQESDFYSRAACRAKPRRSTATFSSTTCPKISLLRSVRSIVFK